MKKIIILIIIIFAALFILAAVRDVVIKDFLAAGIKKVTGADVRIGKFSLSFLTQTVKINNFKMYNPQGFPKGILADLPYMKVSLDVAALFKNELHLKELTIDLKELQLIRNKEKELNVDALKPAKEKEATTGKKAESMRIDVLNLNIGRIVEKDYSVEGGPSVQVYDLNIRKSYRNITSMEQLIMLILSESMKSAGIRGAKLYGLSLLTGVGVIPIVAATTFLGKDSAEGEFNYSSNRVYDEVLKILTKSGTIKKANKASGFISANIEGADVSADISEIQNNKSRIRISARKFFFPKPEIANGILYQIEEKLR